MHTNDYTDEIRSIWRTRKQKDAAILCGICGGLFFLIVAGLLVVDLIQNAS